MHKVTISQNRENMRHQRNIIQTAKSFIQGYCWSSFHGCNNRQ